MRHRIITNMTWLIRLIFFDVGSIPWTQRECALAIFHACAINVQFLIVQIFVRPIHVGTTSFCYQNIIVARYPARYMLSTCLTKFSTEYNFQPIPSNVVPRKPGIDCSSQINSFRKSPRATECTVPIQLSIIVDYTRYRWSKNGKIFHTNFRIQFF
jgi:hypothetical protein